jgi:hypothetical protein
MPIHISPHFWLSERQLVWRNTHYRTILFVQAVYPVVGLPLENLPMIGEDASPSRQRAWKCSQWVQEDVVETFQPNANDLLQLMKVLTDI